MLYKLFLYNTTANKESAAIGIINKAISSHSKKVWQNNGAEDFMKKFNANMIINKINHKLGDKCKTEINYSLGKNNDKPYISISTSYEQIENVLPEIYIIAIKEKLALYDNQTNRTLYNDAIDYSHIKIRLQCKNINQSLMKRVKSIYRIRKIEDYKTDREEIVSYVVTLKKESNISLKNRINYFYDCLQTCINKGEDFVCENESYVIKGTGYKITYCLESYGKHSDKICFGKNQSKLHKRMGIEYAMRTLKNYDETELSDINARMRFREMVQKYPNPADRFIASINITKWQRKEKICIRYSEMGYYGSEIVFHIVPDEFYNDAAEISVLKIDEDDASIFLRIINDFYPYFYEYRYYLIENHLPCEMWSDIIDRMKEIRNLVINDSYNPILKKYIEKYDLNMFPDENLSYEEKLYKYRYDVAHLYDIFIKWSESQLNYYLSQDRMFNIQGP